MAMEELVWELLGRSTLSVELASGGLGVSSDGPAQPRGAAFFICSHSEGECIEPYGFKYRLPADGWQMHTSSPRFFPDSYIQLHQLDLQDASPT